MVKVKDTLREIEYYAPLPLQEGFDNAGVQVGDVNQHATGVLLCLGVTEEVLDEVIEMGYNLIIPHHLLALKSLKSLTGSNYIRCCMMKACKYDLVAYAAHTNLDNAVGDVSYRLAELIGLQNVRILSPQKGALLKSVTFVPEAYAEIMRNILFNTGTGSIGNYDACSYNLHGEGTFRANAGCNPFCGETGGLHVEKEVCIEMILLVSKKAVVIRTLLPVHPYEEPAFDFYSLSNTWEQAGPGVVGELSIEEDELSLLLRIKAPFNVGCVEHSPFTGKLIQEVAICGGNGVFLTKDAIAYGADVFIAGEVKYNDFYDVEDRILLAAIGHYESEIYTKDIFYNIISRKFPTFTVHFSNVNSSPVKYLQDGYR